VFKCIFRKNLLELFGLVRVFKWWMI